MAKVIFGAPFEVDEQVVQVDDHDDIDIRDQRLEHPLAIDQEAEAESRRPTQPELRFRIACLGIEKVKKELPAERR